MFRYTKHWGLVLATCAFTTMAFSGNSDRSGQAGGTQLLINPYSRSSGMGGANTASVSGLEAQFLNVAGLATVPKTEILISRTNWLMGSGININTVGFAQKVGSAGALGLGIMAMDYGDINITTTENPEGNIGTYSPQMLNLSLSYAKEFSNSIFGGINVKVLSENISNLKAQGICFDAGIQYLTTFGKTDKELKRPNTHFGISLKNVGPQMSYEGDGLNAKAFLASNNAAQTLEYRSQLYDLPSLVNIGAAYDFYLQKANNNHKLSAAFNFTSNSFTKDQFIFGAEYSFKAMFMARLGYVYEKDILNAELRTTALTGPTAGVTAEVPLKKDGVKMGFDYAYRTTNPFSGCHTMGIRLKF